VRVCVCVCAGMHPRTCACVGVCAAVSRTVCGEYSCRCAHNYKLGGDETTKRAGRRETSDCVQGGQRIGCHRFSLYSGGGRYLNAVKGLESLRKAGLEGSTGHVAIILGWPQVWLLRDRLEQDGHVDN